MTIQGLTADSEVNRMLPRLLELQRGTLGARLLGLYLYGSLVWGDYDAGISDVDLLATLPSELTAAELEALRGMHAQLVAEFPAWDDRIEVQYLAQGHLAEFKTATAQMGVISPGEPLHMVPANRAWLSNWYSVQERGITLCGPPPHTLIAPISDAEFLEDIRAHTVMWRERVADTRSSRPFQSYAILSVCRAWRSLAEGRQVSKREAALWAKQQLPAYAPLIDAALRWRADARRPVAHPEATYDEAAHFVHMVLDHIASEGLT